MKPRMLCTDCFETSPPQTLLPGSDRLEWIGWLCFALPGWLYCVWRHALRVKACGVCGSFALVREARAAAAQRPCAEPAPPPAPVRSVRGPVRWPRPYATPRERLHAGAPGALAAAVALLCVGLAAAAPERVPLIAVFLTSAAAVAGFCLARGLRLWLRHRALQGACRAWLPDGREIHIELA